MTNAAAALTLHLAQLVQPRNQRRPDRGWMFWPDGVRATWEEAADVLAAAPKPVIVAPLVEPGFLGLWTHAHVGEERRAAFAAQLANQQQYYREKLDALGFTSTEVIHAEWVTTAFTISVADFLDWSRDYVMPVPISVERSPDSGRARVIVAPPGGGGPPLGRGRVEDTPAR